MKILKMKNALLIFSLCWIGCTYPNDRKDNPHNEPVVHTGNATDTFPVDGDNAVNTINASALTKEDSARMVFNDDSSVSGTPSGRGTNGKGQTVNSGASKPGENYPNPNHSNDSAYKK
jgi:hypothetical protein